VHIITIEDPLEYEHANRAGIVEQREIGHDAPSFAEALRSTLREDPDVVLVGEMRDLESIAIALTIAETGHLVLGTLHTNDAAQAVHRVVDVFPSGQQQQIRTQLASTLACVVHQELLPRIGGGRIAAFEVMMASPAVSNLIRDNKTSQLRNTMLTSSKDGMCTLEMSLTSLVEAGLVSYEDAVSRSLYPEEIRKPAPVAPPPSPSPFAPTSVRRPSRVSAFR
jgi:twitching motility protein PilT